MRWRRASPNCFPEITSPPGKHDWSKVGMEQRRTIPCLHEARPFEGGVDHQAEGGGGAQSRDSRSDERLREEGPDPLVGLQSHGRATVAREAREEAYR